MERVYFGCLSVGLAVALACLLWGLVLEKTNLEDWWRHLERPRIWSALGLLAHQVVPHRTKTPCPVCRWWEKPREWRRRWRGR